MRKIFLVPFLGFFLSINGLHAVNLEGEEASEIVPHKVHSLNKDEEADGVEGRRGPLTHPDRIRMMAESLKHFVNSQINGMQKVKVMAKLQELSDEDFIKSLDAAPLFIPKRCDSDIPLKYIDFFCATDINRLMRLGESLPLFISGNWRNHNHELEIMKILGATSEAYFQLTLDNISHFTNKSDCSESILKTVKLITTEAEQPKK